jgi:hypothetical protein
MDRGEHGTTRAPFNAPPVASLTDGTVNIHSRPVKTAALTALYFLPSVAVARVARTNTTALIHTSREALFVVRRAFVRNMASSSKYWLMKAEPDSRVVKGKDVKVCILVMLSLRRAQCRFGPVQRR